jgi:transposase-like protein
MLVTWLSMDPPSLEPETRALARRALILRDRGTPYAAIGKALGFSGGKAHHLVRQAQPMRADDAREVGRPPGRPGAKTPSRGAELRRRLGLDYRRVRRVVENRIDLSDEETPATDVRERLIWIDAEFEVGCRWLDEALSDLRIRLDEGSGGIRSAEGPEASTEWKEEQCLSVEQRFADLLRIAVDAEPVLREVGEDFVLGVFGRELAELAELLGIEFTPATEAPRPSLGHGTGSTAHREPEPPVSLDAGARSQRNERIVTARLSGASATEVAEAYGVSTRQVRRIMAEHRRGRYVVAPAVIDAMGKALEAMGDDLEQLEGRVVDTSDPEEILQQVEDRVTRLTAIGPLLVNAGVFSPHMYAVRQSGEAAERRTRLQVTREVNGRLQRLLKDCGVTQDVIELAMDEVMEGTGVEELLASRGRGRRGADIVQP